MNFDLEVPTPQLWNREISAVFCKVKDSHGVLSNMANGMPLKIIWNIDNEKRELTFGSSEALYQALAFTKTPEYIYQIQGASSAYVSKLLAYKHIDQRRFDWEDIKIKAMAFALTAKLQSTRFQDALTVTGTQDIVELSMRDQFWGASPCYLENTLYGRNILGRLLTQLKNGARQFTFDECALPK